MKTDKRESKGREEKEPKELGRKKNRTKELIEAEESYIGLILQTIKFSLTAQFLCNNRGGFSLVPRPHPAFCHLQYGKAGQDLGMRLGWIIMRTISV